MRAASRSVICLLDLSRWAICGGCSNVGRVDIEENLKTSGSSLQLGPVVLIRTCVFRNLKWGEAISLPGCETKDIGRKLTAF